MVLQLLGEKGLLDRVAKAERSKKERDLVTTASAELSRRQFIAAAGLTAATAWLTPRALFAQSDDVLVPGALKEAATAKVTVQTLRRNVSVLYGPGGNIAVLTGPDGKLLVDAEIVSARPNVSAALTSISAEPVKQLINTHWHFDHTGGNEWLHEAGASILAHENTRKHLSKDTRVEGWKHTFPAAPAGAIPSTVFTTLKKQGRSLEEIVAAKPGARTDEEWGKSFMSPSAFVALVYQGV